MSDDARTAIVVIALLGSPFSPGYARARATRKASALHFCALNVGLYAAGASRWALHERRVDPCALGASGLAIGESTMSWQGGRLVIEVVEQTPLGRPMRGRVILEPQTLTDTALPIDARGEHLWWPVAPRARIHVHLREPAVRFSGMGYHDANVGSTPLEQAFQRWSWSRAHAGQRALLTYDVVERDGEARALAFEVGPSGRMERLEGLAHARLSTTGWGVARSTLADRGHPVRVVRGLEDGPFYARALITARVAGHPVLAMHEVLDAHRLSRPWVRFLTRFRMRGAA